MKLNKSCITILHQDRDLSINATTGISLHCHTEFSKESLDFVPYHLNQVPFFSKLIESKLNNLLQLNGKPIDFPASYFLPPLDGKSVVESETHRIEKLGLDAIISITDHDCINANVDLQDSTEFGEIPISIEWTVPYEEGYFHLGVHNLPKEQAEEITKSLLEFTFSTSDESKSSDDNLSELFSLLNSFREVLIVFNHPIWDIEMVGQVRHLQLLQSFLVKYGRWIHALEINGFREWSENLATIELSETFDLPLVSGGDRHSCKPNTVINTTKSTTFAEFTDEIRNDKYSEVVLLPQYHEPVSFRITESFGEITNFYPDSRFGRRNWLDRVFIQNTDGETKQASELWENGEPALLSWLSTISRTFARRSFLPIFDLFRKRNDFVIPPKKKFENPTKSYVPQLAKKVPQKTNRYAS